MKDLIEDTIKAMEELEEVNKNSTPAEKKSETSNDNSEKKVNKVVRNENYRKLYIYWNTAKFWKR